MDSAVQSRPMLPSTNSHQQQTTKSNPQPPKSLKRTPTRNGGSNDRSRLSSPALRCILGIALVIIVVVVVGWWSRTGSGQQRLIEPSQADQRPTTEDSSLSTSKSKRSTSSSSPASQNAFIFSSVFGSVASSQSPSGGSCSSPFGGGSAFLPSGIKSPLDALNLRQAGKAALQRGIHELLEYGPRVGGSPESPGYSKTQAYIEDRMRCSVSQRSANFKPKAQRKWWTAYEETFDVVDTPLGRKRFINYIADFNGASTTARNFVPAPSVRAQKGKTATPETLEARFGSAGLSGSYPGHLILAAHWDSKLMQQGEHLSEFLETEEVSACIDAGEITPEVGNILLETASVSRRTKLTALLSTKLGYLTTNGSVSDEDYFQVYQDAVTAAITQMNTVYTQLKTLKVDAGITEEMFGKCLARRKPKKKEFVGGIDSAAPMVILLEIMKFISTAAEAAFTALRSGDDDEDGASSLSLPGFPKITVLLFDGEEAFVEWKGSDNTYGARLQAEKWEKDEADFYRKAALHGDVAAASPSRSTTTPLPPYNLLSGVTTFLLLDLVGHVQTTMHNFFHDHTGKQYGRLQRIEQRLSGGVSGEGYLDPYWRRWCPSAYGTLQAATAASSPLKLTMDTNMPETMAWGAVSLESPVEQLTHTLLQVAKQQHLHSKSPTPMMIPKQAALSSIAALKNVLKSGASRQESHTNLTVFRPPVGRGPYFPYEPKGVPSGMDDDHKHFLARGVPILHLITAPFPPVWHELSDDEDHLNMDLIYEFTLMLAEYSISYCQDRYVANNPAAGGGGKGGRLQQKQLALPRYRFQQRASAP